jgi:hypothetical protein
MKVGPELNVATVYRLRQFFYKIENKDKIVRKLLFFFFFFYQVDTTCQS